MTIMIMMMMAIWTTLAQQNEEVERWGILSAFPLPMPVSHKAAIFPRFFTTNKTIDLPYLPFDSQVSPLGRNQSFPEEGFLCFSVSSQQDDSCIQLQSKIYGRLKNWMWRNKRKINKRITYDTFSIISWLQGAYVVIKNNTVKANQPKIIPYCWAPFEESVLPWTGCQSPQSNWVDSKQKFTISPAMEPQFGNLTMLN